MDLHGVKIMPFDYKLETVWSSFFRMINENELIKTSVIFNGLANCYEYIR
jgi:hypothetical protein